MQQMAPNTSGATQDPSEQNPADAQEDQGGTSIELNIAADGSLTVSMEPGDTEAPEGQEQEAPAKDLKDALRMIQQMAQSILNNTSQPAAQQQEDQSYQQTMADPTA